ncbi:dTDP-4-dehydrorhamnose reductase [Cohnella hashimotonis]|uniref:dTDP-4-dehydrorhamnose reductase n=1 Tax=Cohnella hashimotonis TaxID=2826895 RepID=A0ABT6TTW8_9BACL|nr:dTDP-4-dehydrorhamnose reductase [Cohnella hashimotonis]MDI4650302.1 dTDP-4-dehydrorhamnose reductase [Cohnella hashimotonis]
MLQVKPIVLVTGASGQLGQELLRYREDQVAVVGKSRTELDVTDLKRCREVLADLKPSTVIHAGAYTAVDKAESESDLAYQVNAVGTRNLALAAREIGAKLCYISTDYVFDGMTDIPYNEYDNTNPQSIYGKSKRAGEILVQSLCSSYFIVRTSWVFGKYGSNFVKTMLKLAQQNDTLKVVHDQIGSPTYTKDLAAFIFQLIRTENYGIYHASNSGQCSWFEFAQAIFEERNIQVHVTPCTTEEFPRQAKRPPFAILDHAAIRQNGFSDLQNWRTALREFLQEIE